MSPETSALAAETVGLAHAFGDRLTRARCESFTPAERQADAAKAMMILMMFEEKVSTLRKLMPRSANEGQAMRRDLQEISS